MFELKQSRNFDLFFNKKDKPKERKKRMSTHNTPADDGKRIMDQGWCDEKRAKRRNLANSFSFSQHTLSNDTTGLKFKRR
jgi:hypothetical protein